MLNSLTVILRSIIELLSTTTMLRFWFQAYIKQRLQAERFNFFNFSLNKLLKKFTRLQTPTTHPNLPALYGYTTHQHPAGGS